MAATSGTGNSPAPGASQQNGGISLGQRMGSASCGSFLTSLLGIFPVRLTELTDSLDKMLIVFCYSQPS